MREKVIDIIKSVTNYMELENDLEIDLLESGIIDSLSFIELVSELERVFNIEIQLTEIPSETWKYIDNIVEMIEIKCEENKNQK